MFLKKCSIIGLVVCIVSTFSLTFANPIKFARYPNICNGKIAFSYHGDIWIADENGSNPRRLTAHVADDVFPRFSPNGKWIAFSSNRMGNNDVYVVPAEGGEPRQLTFHTTGDDIQYWTPDGKSIIFSSNRSNRPFFSPLYTVSIDGKIPMPMEMDQGRAGMISQDGSKIAFNRTGFTYWRKGYKGNQNTDIYVQDLKTKIISQLTDANLKEFRGFRQDAYPMWGADGQIYFMSERDNTFNIWKISPNGGEPKQVTFHKKDGAQYPSINPDGSQIIYENEFELWKLQIPDGIPEKIIVDLSFDPKENLVVYLRAENKADGFYPSGEGDYVAVDFHGEIFVVPTEAGIGEIKQVTTSSWRDRYEQYSPDGKLLLYISDESGEEEIWIYNLQSNERRKLTTHKSMKGRRRSREPLTTIWSADSKHIAFTALNKLFLIDVEKAKLTELDYHQAGGYLLHEFSPDGKWLVITLRDDDENADVHLYNIAEKKAYNVTQNPFRESGGELTPDAKYLIFTSTRIARTSQLFKVPLLKLTEDPDDPLEKERLKKIKKSEKQKNEAPPKISLDMNDIKRRAMQITTGSNAVGNFFLSKDGETIYFTSNDEKGPGLFSINLNGKNREKIADGDFHSMIPTENRKMIFYSRDNNIFKMNLANKKGEKVSFNFTVSVDKRIEWKQMFEESWRVMKYIFYDENMHGKDWEAIRNYYRPYLKYVGLNQDVYDLTNEMIGELNASHTGVRGPTRTAPTTYTTRYLGFEMIPDKGMYKVSHIYRDGPADKDWINLKLGDYVLAIDGKEIKAGDNYWKTLNHTLNGYVTVKIASEPNTSSKTARDIRMRTVTSLRNIKYEEWVKNNREYVEKFSKGKIAYVHIRSMNQSSLRVSENEI